MQDRTGRARSGIRRPLLAVLLLVGLGAVCAVPACSTGSLYANRGDALQQDLSRFHLALLMQDTPALMRQLPEEARPVWADALSCFFGRFRLVDYRIQEIKTGPKAEDARVVVWARRHPVDSLSTLESIWVQEWVYMEGGWSLDTESETTRKFLGDCLPPEAEKREPGTL